MYLYDFNYFYIQLMCQGAFLIKATEITEFWIFSQTFQALAKETSD